MLNLVMRSKILDPDITNNCSAGHDPVRGRVPSTRLYGRALPTLQLFQYTQV